MSTNINGLARYIIFGLVADNGATVNLYGYSPSEGYMVGGVVEEEVFTHTSNTAHVRAVAFIKDHEDILSDPELFIGAWLNEETNMVHLDISQRFSTMEEAAEVASFRDELAIWDLGTSKEIRVRS